MLDPETPRQILVNQVYHHLLFGTPLAETLYYTLPTQISTKHYRCPHFILEVTGQFGKNHLQELYHL